MTLSILPAAAVSLTHSLRTCRFTATLRHRTPAIAAVAPPPRPTAETRRVYSSIYDIRLPYAITFDTQLHLYTRTHTIARVSLILSIVFPKDVNGHRLWCRETPDYDQARSPGVRIRSFPLNFCANMMPTVEMPKTFIRLSKNIILHETCKYSLDLFLTNDHIE